MTLKQLEAKIEEGLLVLCEKALREKGYVLSVKYKNGYVYL